MQIGIPPARTGGAGGRMDQQRGRGCRSVVILGYTHVIQNYIVLIESDLIIFVILLY